MIVQKKIKRKKIGLSLHKLPIDEYFEALHILHNARSVGFISHGSHSKIGLLHKLFC
jgi:hypothetical protein